MQQEMMLCIEKKNKSRIWMFTCFNSNFLAIYKMLFISLEMRHSHFLLIKDLSVQDPTSLFNLFGLIPWDPPSFMIIGIWPILMGASMWVQQKLNPAMADPIQAKYLPSFHYSNNYTCIISFRLVVYWTINNILTIAQQYVIVKKTTVKLIKCQKMFL